MYNPIEVSQAAAKAREELEKNGSVGYTQKNSITWDGNTEGLTLWGELGIPLYLVSDKVISPGEMTVTFDDGTSFTAVTEELVPGMIMLPEGMAVSAKAGAYTANGVTITIPASGIYFAKVDNGRYITSISYKTIHPIDPKFLPGVCLPVVELSTTVANGATFTDAENAALSEAFNTKLPFVVHTNLSIGDIAVKDAVAVSQCGTMEGIGMIALVFGTTVLQLVERDGAWVVT